MEDKVFSFEGNEVRLVGENWVVASDICKGLGLNNVSMALERVEKDDITTTEVIDSLGRKQMTDCFKRTASPVPLGQG